MRRLPLLVLAVLAPALAPAGALAAASYTPCEPVPGAAAVAVARAGCAEAQAAAAALVAQPPERAGQALAPAGWTPLRAADTGRGSHDLVALRGRAAVLVRRGGAAPDLDGWSAGRELVFARATIVGGRPIPRGAAFCTSAFLVRLSGGRRGGLSAAHCAGLRRSGLVARRNAALRRPPAPGIVLGRVLRTTARRAPLDALALPVPRGTGRTASSVVDRGIARPPWPVVGTARPLRGRRVCFTGRTSGADRCGRIASRAARPAEAFLGLRTGLIVRCTTIRARQGDSGGPVYTAPRGDGTVRAVGLVTLVAGPSSAMCFTPLGPVLDRLGARLVAQAQP
ncbi:MAG TPA: hypothetical protein VD931_19390 [Baekduia sp.]|nr:hypothetical protein [Baekduia sp.]